MALSNYLVRWVVTYLGDLQPTFIGVIIYLLSSMDIPVRIPYRKIGEPSGKIFGKSPPKGPLKNPVFWTL